MIGPFVVVAALLSGASLQEGDPWLDAALETARWLKSVGTDTEHGRTWPTQLEGEPETGLGLYSGAPGVVLFFLEAHAQTGHAEYLDEARAGADDVLHRLSAAEATSAGLYTGLAGVGFTLCEVGRATGDTKYRDGANRVVDVLTDRAIEEKNGVHWNGVTDVISGSAGIGLFLLYAGEELDRDDARSLAARAGDHLVAAGRPVDDGTKWAMSDDYAKLMPNFSHGTAGVSYFLVELHRATGESRYLDAARRGAVYLRSIMRPQTRGGGLIFHSEPGNEELFYLSWCHGPAGTVRFLHALEAASRDERWRSCAATLEEGLAASGMPARSPGFWNNAGLCCGDAGVADFLIALEAGEQDEARAALAEALLSAILERSTLDEGGRRWTHAEHRVQPELLTTQTGLMQGAAGIGLVLLRASAHAAGRPVRVRLPDEPW